MAILYKEARRLLLDAVEPAGRISVPVEEALGLTTAGPVIANVTQPPFAASAMDGYAVRFGNGLAKGASLRVVGEAPAGTPWKGQVGAAEAVRIFTGSVIPPGADHVVIQENVQRKDDVITLTVDQMSARNIRAAGIDFRAGDIVIEAGERLQPASLSLAAAANAADLDVYRRPRVAILCIGDELLAPGTEPGEGQIIDSLSLGLAALSVQWGAVIASVSRLGDRLEDIVSALDRAVAENDIVILVGGASVGDYDFAKTAFAKVGGELVFNKVAIKPGKPVWFGKAGAAAVLGLPGNPASALTCAWLFLHPLADKIAGHAVPESLPLLPARLAVNLAANGPREHYMRGNLALTGDGQLLATPHASQDSSLLSVFAVSSCLIHLEAEAREKGAGDIVSVLPIGKMDHSLCLCL